MRASDIQFRKDGTGVLVTIDGDVWLARGLGVGSAEVRVQRKSSLPRGFTVNLLSAVDGTFRVENALVGDFSVSAANPANGLGGSADGTLPSPAAGEGSGVGFAQKSVNP